MINEEDLTELSVDQLGLMYQTVREARLSAQRSADDMKGDESLVKAALMRALGESEGIVSAGKAIAVVHKSRPYVSDYRILSQYVLDTGNLQVFNRALNSKALSELDNVPGVEYYEYDDLSVTKVK